MSRLSVISFAAFILPSVVSAPSAFAQCDDQNYYWVIGSGDWSTPENWQHEVWDPELEQCVPASGVPGSDDNA